MTKNLKLVQGDITTACVDAIVNAANPAMLGGGGVDGAIHRTAGLKLLDACKSVESRDGVRCPTGEARITDAGKLKARFVIHTVGPRYNTDPKPEKLLASAYHSALRLALDNGCESIAFPAISCGVYGYPKDQAARIAIDICSLKPYKNLKIYLYLFDDKTLDIWQRTLAEKINTNSFHR